MTSSDAPPFDEKDFNYLRLRSVGVSVESVIYISNKQLGMLIAEIDRLKDKVNSYYVHGSIQCRNCEDGRITIYERTGRCEECLEKKGNGK